MCLHYLKFSDPLPETLIFLIWPYGKWQLTSSGVAVIDGYLVFSLVTPSPTVLSILIAVILNKTKITVKLLIFSYSLAYVLGAKRTVSLRRFF